MNKEWHQKNILGKNASLAKRIDWHLRHQEHCACREIPKIVSAAIKGGQIKTCSRRHKYIGKGPCPICWPASTSLRRGERGRPRKLNS